jgi:hypothetical protein
VRQQTPRQRFSDSAERSFLFCVTGYTT